MLFSVADYMQQRKFNLSHMPNLLRDMNKNKLKAVHVFYSVCTNIVRSFKE